MKPNAKLLVGGGVVCLLAAIGLPRLFSEDERPSDAVAGRASSNTLFSAPLATRAPAADSEDEETPAAPEPEAASDELAPFASAGDALVGAESAPDAPAPAGDSAVERLATPAPVERTSPDAPRDEHEGAAGAEDPGPPRADLMREPLALREQLSERIASLRLAGVLRGTDDAWAILNDRLLRVGDLVEGELEVVAIEPRSVRLRWRSLEGTVFLPPFRSNRTAPDSRPEAGSGSDGEGAEHAND